MYNKVVARFVDGRLIKGTTFDFFPGKDVFHLLEADGPPGGHTVPIRTRDLKALFFVKDLVGDPGHSQPPQSAEERSSATRKIRVLFRDGEVMVGTTPGYHTDRQGFFLEPADGSLNEEHCYVVARAVKQVTYL